MGAGRAIAGGLLVGLGEGMSAQAKSRAAAAAKMREAALEEARALRERRWEREDADRAAKAERGSIHSIEETDQGLVAVTKGMETKPLGLMPADDGSGSGGTGKGYGTTELNAIERMSNRYWGQMNADGQYFVSPEQRDNYVSTVQRAEQLVRDQGLNIGEAVLISAQSISGPITEEKAREMAEAEAKEQEFEGSRLPWTGPDGASSERGSNRKEWIDRRASELYDESQSALKKFERLTGGGKTSGRGGLMPEDGAAAQGGGEQPTAASKQAGPPTSGPHANAPKINSKAAYDKLASGAVFWNERTGRLERKP